MSELQIIGLTDSGRMRDQNEDHIAIAAEAGLVVVADGMGGHRAGEVASRLAVETVVRHIVMALTEATGSGSGAIEVAAMRDAIQQANQAIHNQARASPEQEGMGSTIVVALFYGDKLCVGHVGDSRLYRYRDTILEQVTEDHSVVQELVSRGLVTAEEARVSISKNLVTRALGIDPAVEADISEHDVYDDDVYLLCSDGINDVLADGDIELMLTEHGRNLDTTAKALVDTANVRGGPDNISVIMVRVRGGFERNPEELQKLRERLLTNAPVTGT
ncbi:MAG: Stp1/IreP family PP2C-type Ser/Thr phosphatase [Gammaproteobacteria bacterium]|nr:Stp1/IreP family PP2C-type Ser/Thr phosphatase [Gammaproteobacteria bacterium]MDH3370057.1 Stp1/IreP family PP2C-type Ser/Thr phosphatase [Gammaproteobacteria bacterium]MDH3405626.1 Stp1/IreP family PP2C-type Ser/Thr phosphatase [Gammaproteobacteria bacterium]MDH5487112.1 Stp1/IreP family PP2C-type Ser/Thr phosphatase [Gammaproteobacteria bacterium]